MAEISMLDRAKKALRITTNAFDDEITMLIGACILDLNIAGVEGNTVTTTTTDPLVIQAIIAYCKWRFGDPENPEKKQELYELQKAQLMVATGYTEWSESNGQVESNDTL